MTTLANTLAGTRQLPLITDDPIFQPLISGLQTEPIEQQDISMELASIVIKTVVPVNIESLPVKTIMKFREDYRDERRQFYVEINKLVGTFPTITHPDSRQRFLEERSEDIRLAVKDLRRAMKGIGLTHFWVWSG